MRTFAKVPVQAGEAMGGGHGAAVLVEGEDAPRAWLMPFLLLIFLLAPLLRAGIPATRAGLLPLLPELTSELVPSMALPLVIGGAAAFKGMLAAHIVVAACAVGGLARVLWGARRGWWVAALWLTLPLTVSFALQGGWVYLLQGVILLAVGGIVLRTVHSPARWLALLLWAWAGAVLWGWQPGLEPFQLFASAWPSADNLREWIGVQTYSVGFVPFVLTIVGVAVAWPRRDEAAARVVLSLAVVAGIALLATVAGGPVILWLVVASLAMVLVAGGLTVLDERYASFPVLLVAIALSALTVYPALQPAWLEDVSVNPAVATFVGDSQFALLDVQVQRDGEVTVVEVTWQATRPALLDYTAFVHLLDGAGTIIAQADTLLLDEENVPSSRWPSGYVVRQRYGASSGEAPAQVRLGLYDGATLQRLLFADGSDSLTVAVP